MGPHARSSSRSAARKAFPLLFWVCVPLPGRHCPKLCRSRAPTSFPFHAPSFLLPFLSTLHLYLLPLSVSSSVMQASWRSSGKNNCCPERLDAQTLDATSLARTPLAMAACVHNGSRRSCQGNGVRAPFAVAVCAQKNLP